MTDTLTRLYPLAPSEAIPTFKAKVPYLMLPMFGDGKPVTREALTERFGESWRSALQSLRGDRFGYWLIHSIKTDNSKTTLLQLDPRHLSGDAKQDAAARLERRKQLKNVSYKEAQQGWKRMPKAHTAMLEADKAYFKSLGEAANDSE